MTDRHGSAPVPSEEHLWTPGGTVLATSPTPSSTPAPGDMSERPESPVETQMVSELSTFTHTRT